MMEAVVAVVVVVEELEWLMITVVVAVVVVEHLTMVVVEEGAGMREVMPAGWTGCHLEHLHGWHLLGVCSPLHFLFLKFYICFWSVVHVCTATHVDSYSNKPE